MDNEEEYENGQENEEEQEHVYFGREHTNSLNGFFICIQDINDFINELHNSISQFEYAVGSYYSDYYKEEFSAISDCLKKASNLMTRARRQLLSLDKVAPGYPHRNDIRGGYRDGERIEQIFSELKDHLEVSIKMSYSDGVREFAFNSEPKNDGTYCLARKKHAAPWRLGKDHLHLELKKLIKDKLIEEIEKELGEDKTRMTMREVRELLKKNKDAP